MGAGNKLAITVLITTIGMTHAHAGQIRIWPTAVVVGGDITIGDLCELTGFEAAREAEIRKHVVAGLSSPPPGGSVVVSSEQIHQALRAAGVNLASTTVGGASRCGVRRTAAVAAPPSKRRAPAGSAAIVLHSSLRDAVGSFLEVLIDRTDGHVELQFGKTAASVLDLTEPEFQFVIRRQSGRVLGLVNLEVDILRDGEVVQSVPMIVSARYRLPVLIANRAINQRATVEAKDVTLVERAFARLEEIGLTHQGEVVGMRAKTFIPPGTMLTGRALETVPLVRRGQLTEIQSSAGGIMVETVGKAINDGSYGDIVELRTGGRRGVTIRGVVIGPGRVDVSIGIAIGRDRGQLARR